MDSWSSSETESESVSHGQGVRYEYDSVPTYRPLEESFHRAAAALMQLETGYGYLLYNPSRPPIKIRTYLPKERHVDEQLLEMYTAAVLQRMGALSPVAARQLIQARRTRLLDVGTAKPSPLRLEHRSKPARKKPA